MEIVLEVTPRGKPRLTATGMRGVHAERQRSGRAGSNQLPAGPSVRIPEPLPAQVGRGAVAAAYNMGSRDATEVDEVATGVRRDAVAAAYEAAVQDAINCLPEAATDEMIEAAVEASEAMDVALESMLEVGPAIAVTMQAMETAMHVVTLEATMHVEAAPTQVDAATLAQVETAALARVDAATLTQVDAAAVAQVDGAAPVETAAPTQVDPAALAQEEQEVALVRLLGMQAELEARAMETRLVVEDAYTVCEELRSRKGAGAAEMDSTEDIAQGAEVAAKEAQQQVRWRGWRRKW